MVDRARRPAFAETARALRDAGASALELGFPFSDPIADGPVLEAAAQRALDHGTTWADLRTAARLASPILPTAVMTYANPILRRGRDTAFAELAADGVSGAIVPDLSLEESGPWRKAARAARIALVLLAAPGGSTARVRSIATASRGFLYLVSRYGTTGRSGAGKAVDLSAIVRESHRAAPELPVLLGFGVRDRASARRALATGADGIIIGTALEEAVARGLRPRALGAWLGAVLPRSGQPAAG